MTVLSLGATGKSCPEGLLSGASPRPNQWHLAVIGLSDENHPVPTRRRLSPTSTSISAAATACLLRSRQRSALSPATSQQGHHRRPTALSGFRNGGSSALFLQLLHFNTPLLLDDRTQLGEAQGTVPRLERVDSYDGDRQPEVAAATGPITTTPAARPGVRPTSWPRPLPTRPRRKVYGTSVIFEYGDKRARSGRLPASGGLRRDDRQHRTGLKRMGPAEDPLEALGLHQAD